VYLKNSDFDKQYANSSRCEQDKYVSYTNAEGGVENGDDDSPVSLHNNSFKIHKPILLSI